MSLDDLVNSNILISSTRTERWRKKCDTDWLRCWTRKHRLLKSV